MVRYFEMCLSRSLIVKHKDTILFRSLNAVKGTFAHPNANTEKGTDLKHPKSESL